VLFLPFLRSFSTKVVEFAADPGMAVAWAQLIFNLVMVLLVLLLLQVFHRPLESIDETAARAAA
jgi:Na+/phosphate symporter